MVNPQLNSRDKTATLDEEERYAFLLQQLRAWQEVEQAARREAGRVRHQLRALEDQRQQAA